MTTPRRRLSVLLGFARRAMRLPRQLADLQAQVGDLQSRAVAQLGPDEIERSEFKVYSQFGEDGVIQFLIQRVPIENRLFVEIGVEDYAESNSRFLLVHDSWRGVIVDASDEHARFLSASRLGWRSTVDAVTAFVDRENVDDILRGAGAVGRIGLLSVDVDGNDYWILDSIQCVSPQILVVEYNSLFGPEQAVTVPYDPTFVRSERHWSNLYWGASLAALAMAAERKGLALVGGNRAGNNAFFVERCSLGDIPERKPPEVWRPAQFRDSRAFDGSLTLLSDDTEKLRVIRELPLVSLPRGETRSVGELFDLS